MLDPITKPEGHSAGDNLILNPQEPQPHLPNIEFQKMEGRPEQEIDKNADPKEGDRLFLNPKKIEKHVADVFFDKQEGRPERV